MRPSSLVGRMRAALREGDLCGAQEAFAKAVQRTSCSRTVKEATAALPVLLRTARETKDAELEERARRALDEASSGASADLRRRRRRREWRRDYFRRQAAASSGGPSREFMEAVLAASVDDDDAGSLEATLARFTGTHALGEALRRSPDRTLQCLNAALHRSRSSSSSRRVLRIMRSWGICPDAYTINAILHHKTTRSCNGSDEDLSKVVRQLWLAGNPPDKYTVSLLCSSLYEWNVDALDALGLIRCFMKFGVQVEASAYEKVLRLCSKQGEEELRRRVLEEMRLIFDREGDLGVGGEGEEEGEEE
ncbi:hypothetical protein HOP50_15g75970 [Chloropicon primus]|uniref:Pentacotripeptide-repeat region of PRORP domain-containing protein n=1 Tax=Chloropicon primus TaxID=1764295 RepID=A0A5B8MZI4_9CHLO|nr:hypothetical protein A3770_15p75700 [Chloropicon primus]UPR04261.1 hypothetical protein HOP50_15g75970 [Chloropicon primus]|eukprot:QDZ25052.1 hypothetical protein A3770_15p75700 [Chloropicon primus]